MGHGGPWGLGPTSSISGTAGKPLNWNDLLSSAEETGKALTPYNYQYDADFNRWLTSLFTDYVGLFEEMTVLFNHKQYETFTPRDMCHLVVNNKRCVYGYWTKC